MEAEEFSNVYIGSDRRKNNKSSECPIINPSKIIDGNNLGEVITSYEWWSPITSDPISLPSYISDILQVLILLKTNHFIQTSINFNLLMRAIENTYISNGVYAFVVKSIFEILLMHSDTLQLEYKLIEILQLHFKELWVAILDLWVECESLSKNEYKLLTQAEINQIHNELRNTTPENFHLVSTEVKMTILKFLSNKLLYLPSFYKVMNNLQKEKKQLLINMLESSDFVDLEALNSNILYSYEGISWEIKGVNYQFVYTEAAPKLLFISNINELDGKWTVYDITQAKVTQIIELNSEPYPIPEKITIFFKTINRGVFTALLPISHFMSQINLNLNNLRSILIRIEATFHKFWLKNNYIWIDDNQSYLHWLRDVNKPTLTREEFSKLFIQFIEGQIYPFYITIQAPSEADLYPFELVPPIFSREESKGKADDIIEKCIKLEKVNISGDIFSGKFKVFYEYFLEICKSENIYTIFTGLIIFEHLLVQNRRYFEKKQFKKRDRRTISDIFSKGEEEIKTGKIIKGNKKIHKVSAVREADRRLRQQLPQNTFQKIDMNRRDVTREKD